VKLVTVYSKPDCCLCDDVMQVVERVAARRRFKLEYVNILDDPALEAKYRRAIPAIIVNGKEIARYRLTEAILDAALTE
jgi:glutaredoxin